METNLTSIPTHFGHTRVADLNSPVHHHRPQEPISQYFRYRNYTGSPISIGWRNGLRVCVRPEPLLRSREFIAIVEITMDPDCAADAHRALAALSDELSPEIKALREVLSHSSPINSHTGARIVLEYPLTLESLEAAGGTVYYSELDIVVSMADPASMPPHPYSEEGRRSQTIAGSPIEHGGVGFGYAIEVVDNHQRYGERYLNIGGQVYKVSPKRDVERRDGVYVISNYAANGSLEQKATQIKYCSFEQAQETLGLYRSYDEALHLGDISQARKAELLTMEHELARAKQELQQTKTEADKADVIRKQELAGLEGENARLLARNQLLERDMEIERQKNKDYYENKSHTRKDTSEQIKILPTIILGITAIISTLIGVFLGGGSKAA